MIIVNGCHWCEWPLFMWRELFTWMQNGEVPLLLCEMTGRRMICIWIIQSVTIFSRLNLWQLKKTRNNNMAIAYYFEHLHFTKICCVVTIGEPSTALFATRQLKFAPWSFLLRCTMSSLLVVPNFVSGSIIFPPGKASPFLVHETVGTGLPPDVRQVNWIDWPSTSAPKVVFSCITGLPGATEIRE